MSKRFTDTDIYQREWYHKLPIKYKAFWDYICRTCNHAGIWNVNIGLAGYLIGTEYDKEEVLKTFNGRIMVLDEDKWYLPKFIYWQYGAETPEDLNIAVKAQGSVYKILSKQGLVKSLVSVSKDLDNSLVSVKQDLSKSSVRVKAKAKDISKDKSIVKDKDKVLVRKKFLSPNLEECVIYFKKKKYNNAEYTAKLFWNHYESQGWYVGKVRMKDWKKAAVGWELRNSKMKDNKRVYIQEDHKTGDGVW